jgi:hypothetical protein
MLGQVEVLRVGQRLLRDAPALLVEAETPTQARAVAPILAALNAPMWAAWDAGRTGLAPGGEAYPDWLALLRIHGLARRAGFPPVTPPR